MKKLDIQIIRRPTADLYERRFYEVVEMVNKATREVLFREKMLKSLTLDEVVAIISKDLNEVIVMKGGK